MASHIKVTGLEGRLHYFFISFHQFLWSYAHTCLGSELDRPSTHGEPSLHGELDHTSRLLGYMKKFAIAISDPGIPPHMPVSLRDEPSMLIFSESPGGLDQLLTVPGAGTTVALCSYR